MNHVVRSRRGAQKASRGRKESRFTYLAFGLRLASNIPLPELEFAGAGRATCHFRLVQAGEPLPDSLAAARWFHRLRLRDGTTWLRMGKTRHGFVLRFSKSADFFCTPDGRTICCRPGKHLPQETLRHLLLDQVLPLALSLRRRLVLHAAAVAVPAGAIAFLGASGWGKSTLAGFLALGGAPLIADDGLCLQETAAEFFTVSSYPGLRLWPNMNRKLFRRRPPLPGVAAHGSKLRVPLPPAALESSKAPIPLQRIYLLDSSAKGADSGNPVLVARATPREAFMALCAHVIRLDLTEPRYLRWEFALLSRLSSKLLFRRLVFPRNFKQLS